MKPTQEMIKAAIEEFGREVVTLSTMMVELTDMDAAYTDFQDLGMSAHAECVYMLYHNS